MPNQEHVAETLGNNSNVFSIFIDNLPENLNFTSFKNMFCSFGEVLDVHIPNKFRKKTGRKYGFIIFATIQEGMKVIST